MKKYFKVWLILTMNSIQSILSTRFGMAIFIFGKLLRFFLYLAFIYFLFSSTSDLIGYSRFETLLFLLTFIIIGSVGQMLFREVYRFRSRLVSGDFDFDLVKPIHPLLRNLGGGLDVLDLITLPIFLLTLSYVLSQLHFTSINLLFYLILCLNGLAIMGAIHILVAGFGVLTTEVDNAILVYRDLETMGRFPVDIYKEPLRQIITFVVPIGIMFTFPVQALLGILSPAGIVAALPIGLLSIFLSLEFWKFAVKKYSSASS